MEEKKRRTPKERLVILESNQQPHSQLKSPPQDTTTSPTRHRRLASTASVKQQPLCRVIAYCTARSYHHITDFVHHLQARNASVIMLQYDECTMVCMSPTDERVLFLMDYGVAVFWGWTPDDEAVFLRQLLSSYEQDPLDEWQEEVLHCVYDPHRTQKIYNDVIVLNQRDNDMAKMTISMGMAQSAKLACFEDLMDETIVQTEHIPYSIAKFGSIRMSKPDGLKAMGQLFNVRTEINLNHPILDTPELFWTERSLLPLYEAVRLYMEISSRVALLNQRALVLGDLLDMLNEYLMKRNYEKLEWIVVWLIVASVALAAMTIYLKVTSLHE